jgi:CubicO group peptidase (beta-lactamase class C family)
VIAERYEEPFGPQVRQHLWSVTKSMVNTIVGNLQMEGKLELGQSIDGQWAAERSRITVQDMLHMRSGLYFPEEYGVAVSLSKIGLGRWVLCCFQA